MREQHEKTEKGKWFENNASVNMEDTLELPAGQGLPVLG